MDVSSDGTEVGTARAGHRRRGPIGLLIALVGVVVVAGLATAPADLRAERAGVPKTNLTTDITDAWWPNSEPGWGVQFVHNAGTVFATLYVYDDAGRPTFYVAVLANTPPGGDEWTGPLSRTTGPVFSGPFDPAAVVESVVGAMTFTLTGLHTGVLVYDVGGVVVTKSLNRQPLALEDNSGEFEVLTEFDVFAGPNCGVDNAPPVKVARLSIDQTADVARLVFVGWAPGIADVCLVDPATYTQAGRFGNYLGTLQCEGSARHAALQLFDVANRVRHLSGRYRLTWDDGCTVLGRFAGILTSP